MAVKGKAKARIRPTGQILLEIEPLLQELLDDHEMQWGDVFGLLKAYLEIHYPGAQEKYVKGGHPVFYYGPEKV